jgi:hypothetical protein
MLSAYVRALLAMLVALNVVVYLAHARTLEDLSEYQDCLVNPSTCTALCASLRFPEGIRNVAAEENRAPSEAGMTGRHAHWG